MSWNLPVFWPFEFVRVLTAHGSSITIVESSLKTRYKILRKSL